MSCIILNQQNPCRKNRERIKVWKKSCVLMKKKICTLRAIDIGIRMMTTAEAVQSTVGICQCPLIQKIINFNYFLLLDSTKNKYKFNRQKQKFSGSYDGGHLLTSWFAVALFSHPPPPFFSEFYIETRESFYCIKLGVE